MRYLNHIPALVIVGSVFAIGLQASRQEQRKVLESCSTGCGFREMFVAQFDVLLAIVVSVPTYSLSGIPVGAVLTVLLLFWLLTLARVDPL